MFVCAKSSAIVNGKVDGVYRLETAVYNVHRMQVLQSAGHICELQLCSGFGYWGKKKNKRDREYDSKAIYFGVLWCEVQDVSFKHPFSDDA